MTDPRSFSRLRSPRALLLILLGLIALSGCGQPLPPPGEATQAQPLAVAGAPGRPEGRLLFARRGNLWVWSDGQEFQLTQEGYYSQPRWSPSGNSLLYVRRGDSYADLYVADSAGKNARALTANQTKAYPPDTKAYVDNSFQLTGPSWSRALEGGDRIVYSTDRESTVLGLWVMNGLNGKAQPVFGTRALGAHIEGAALSPDGTLVAFTAEQATADNSRFTQLFIVDLNTGNFRVLQSTTGGKTEALTGVYDAAWSPDGQWLAYAARQGDETQLWAIRPDGTGRQRIVGDGRNRGPAWSPDGKQIAFARQQGSGFGLFFVDLETTATGFNAGKPQRLGDFADLDPASGVSWVR